MKIDVYRHYTEEISMIHVNISFREDTVTENSEYYQQELLVVFISHRGIAA